MLLKVFHVIIWSSMHLFWLDLVLAHLLPMDLTLQLFFVYRQDECVKRKTYPFFQKAPHQLIVGTRTRCLCKPSNILMVDDCKWKNEMNGKNTYYFLVPWKEKLYLSNQQNIILEVCTTLLSFIMDLIHYDSIIEFLQNTPMDGKFCRRLLNEWHTSRLKQ